MHDIRIELLEQTYKENEMDPLETRLSYLINRGTAWGRSTVLDQYQKQSGRMKIFIEDETMYLFKFLSKESLSLKGLFFDG